MKKTKIICTLGPATDEEPVLMTMIQSGMDIARLNFSHGTKEDHHRRIAMVRRAGEKLGVPVGVLLDTKGPEIRTGKMENGSVTLREDTVVRVTTDDRMGTAECFSVSYKPLPDEVKEGTLLLIDDGILRLKVEETGKDYILCRVINGGELKSNKGVNVPGVKVNLPAITERDEEDIRFGLEEGIDFIAASFVRGREAVESIRAICDSAGKNVFIIAKIENEEGIENIDEIIDSADGIMIARGDLGVEIPAEEVPYLQKKIIEKCNFKMKPVITATQMLDSMMRNPRPTRAFSYQFVKSFPVLSKGFEIETEMSIHAIDKNMYIENVIIEYRDRPEGSESKLNTYSDGLKVLFTILRLYKNYKPLNFFSIISLVLTIISAVFFIPILITYANTGLVPNFPTLIVCGFIVMAAIISLFAGIILQTLRQKDRQQFEMRLIQISDLKKFHNI